MTMIASILSLLTLTRRSSLPCQPTESSCHQQQRSLHTQDDVFLAETRTVQQRGWWCRCHYCHPQAKENTAPAKSSKRKPACQLEYAQTSRVWAISRFSSSFLSLALASFSSFSLALDMYSNTTGVVVGVGHVEVPIPIAD